MSKLFTITRNTFIETIRQPVYAIIITAALLLFFVSPSIAMYTMSDDNKLLRELGLSTLFIASLFIAIFSASGAVAEEIENKTIMTVLTKPVQRPIFILAKFLGVTGAVAMGHYICTIALIMAIRNGVLENVDSTNDYTVLGTAGVALVLTIALSAFLNYTYDWKTTSTAVVLLAGLGTIGLIFLIFFDRDWKFNPANNNINAIDIYGSVLLFLAAVIIAALAVALSCRFNIVVTLSACVGVFLLGLVSDWAFGALAKTHLWAKICYFAIPNLQVFWISDAIYEESTVPLKYVLIGATYAICYTGGILALAVALFQRRQVG
jgi:ABC-type transport system involved in multi-copper enzyme maturation permease subunit